MKKLNEAEMTSEPMDYENVDATVEFMEQVAAMRKAEERARYEEAVRAEAAAYKEHRRRMRVLHKVVSYCFTYLAGMLVSYASYLILEGPGIYGLACVLAEACTLSCAIWFYRRGRRKYGWK